MDSKLSEKEITQLVIGAAMKVHGVLGAGFVEFVYRNALVYELRESGLAVEIEKPLQVRYQRIVVGEFNVDLFINGWLVVELKAVAALALPHELQMVNYLTALNQDYGLLLNFGAPACNSHASFNVRNPPHWSHPTFTINQPSLILFNPENLVNPVLKVNRPNRSDLAHDLPIPDKEVSAWPRRSAPNFQEIRSSSPDHVTLDSPDLHC